MEKMLEEKRRMQEEEYFRRRERSLIERMHQRAALESEWQRIQDAVGTGHEEVVQALQELGYDPETVPLVYLRPLVQVAWADDRLTAREREYIEAAARARGIEVGSAADEQLRQWFLSPLGDEVFRRTLQVIRRLLETLPDEERAATRHELLVSCSGVAAASRGILGIGRKVSASEHLLLEAIEAELT
jgi:hypothetical protein